VEISVILFTHSGPGKVLVLSVNAYVLIDFAALLELLPSELTLPRIAAPWPFTKSEHAWKI
jgi:hypothetical protein